MSIFYWNSDFGFAWNVFANTLVCFGVVFVSVWVIGIIKQIITSYRGIR